MSPYDIFIFLKNKDFPNGKLYSKGIISSAILKLEESAASPYYTSNLRYSYNDIMNELGLTSGGATLLRDFMVSDMKS